MLRFFSFVTFTFLIDHAFFTMLKTCKKKKIHKLLEATPLFFCGLRTNGRWRCDVQTIFLCFAKKNKGLLFSRRGKSTSDMTTTLQYFVQWRKRRRRKRCARAPRTVSQFSLSNNRIVLVCFGKEITNEYDFYCTRKSSNTTKFEWSRECHVSFYTFMEFVFSVYLQKVSEIMRRIDVRLAADLVRQPHVVLVAGGAQSLQSVVAFTSRHPQVIRRRQLIPLHSFRQDLQINCTETCVPEV